MATKIGNLIVTLSANTKGLITGFGSAEKSLTKLKSSTKKNMGVMEKSMNSFKKSVMNIGPLLAATFATGAIVGGISDAIGRIKDFGSATSGLAAVLGKSKAEIKDVTDLAIKLGKATKFTATEVVNAQKELAKLGFDSGQIKASTNAILSLAAAAGTEVPEAAAIGASTLRGFGLDASKMQVVVDVMAKSFSSSALDMEKFSESMKFVAPVAKAVGANVQETTALLGTLANAGISGSMAGTALRKGFIELSGAGLSLNQGLEKIRKSQDKLGTATQLVGKRAATAFLILAEGKDTTAALTEELNNAGGAADRMAETQLDNLAGSMTKLDSAWEGFILSMDEGNGAISQVGMSLAETTTSILTLISSLNSGESAFKSFAAFSADFGKSQLGFNDSVADTIRDLPRYTAILAELQARVKKGTITQKQAQAAIEEYLKNGVKPAVKEVGKLEEQQSGLDKAVKKAIKPSKEQLKIWKAQRKEIKTMNDALTERKNLLKDMKEVVKATLGEGTKGSNQGLQTLQTREFTGTGTTPTGPDKLGPANDFVKLTAKAKQGMMMLGGEIGNLAAGMTKTVTVMDENGEMVEKQVPIIEQLGGSMAALASGDVMGAAISAFSEIAMQSEAFKQVLEVVNQILKLLFDALTPIVEMLFTSLVPLFEALVPIIESLLPVIQILGTQLQMMLLPLEAIVPILELLAPAFEVLGKIVSWVAGVFQAVGDFLSKLFGGKKKAAPAAPPALAKGGLAFGPTLAMVGDNAGAGTNPEVIAPLSKLAGMMGGGKLEAVVRGDQLAFVLNQSNRKLGSTR